MAHGNGPASGTCDRSSAAGGDPLSDVLDHVALEGALLFKVEASDPWCVDVPPAAEYAPLLAPPRRRVISFHVVLSGAGTAALPGGLRTGFRSGDVLVFAQGDAYRMESAPEVPPEFDHPEMIAFFAALAAGRLPFIVEEGGGGAPRAEFVCGFLTAGQAVFDPLLAGLPRLLKVRRPAPGADTLARLVEAAMAAFRTEGPGTGSIRRGLCRLMLAETLRQHLGAAAGAGWLGALSDPVASGALRAIHGDPGAPWTLAGLAREAGASRSVLAARFRDRTGQAPMDYLAAWRMQVAGEMMLRRGLSVEEAAEAVGYGSGQSFSRAFKRIAGQPPGLWLRGARAPA
ncbi:AraC family transcriptional regulator [Poseidonocella sp. HB161398]|uniref:AraC family transcriptional regulator n=1 Tax=Poseidonocella sp. HB161398 TaxID=2320855 RepID=UPI00210578D3|nr:AraC family transcriptional regulator [Poseidonocella sp. HB161398]